MTYLFTLYAVSAILAAFVLLPYVDRAHALVAGTPSPTPTADNIAVTVFLGILILAPVLNSGFVIYSIHCFVKYPDAK